MEFEVPGEAGKRYPFLRKSYPLATEWLAAATFVIARVLNRRPQRGKRREMLSAALTRALILLATLCDPQMPNVNVKLSAVHQRTVLIFPHQQGKPLRCLLQQVDSSASGTASTVRDADANSAVSILQLQTSTQLPLIRRSDSSGDLTVQSNISGDGSVGGGDIATVHAPPSVVHGLREVDVSVPDVALVTAPPTPEVEAGRGVDSSLGDVASVPAPSEVAASVITPPTPSTAPPRLLRVCQSSKGRAGA